MPVDTAPIVHVAGASIVYDVPCSIVRQDGDTVKVIVKCQDGKFFTMVEYPREWKSTGNLTLMQFTMPVSPTPIDQIMPLGK